MQQITDIREYKSRLRTKYKAQRMAMSAQNKAQKDDKIFQRLRSLITIRNCKTVFCYVSTPIEVDTRNFITQALADGKTVAVPRCVPNSRQMEFYAIDSLADLEKGSFSVDEPKPDKKRLVTDYENSICIVPALCFDKQGFRLGYGKGYYDRFLSQYTGNVIGICYSDCIVNSLRIGRYDRQCPIVVTDKTTIIPKLLNKKQKFKR